MSHSGQLVIAKVCPFAHRAWLAALETKAPFEIKDVNIAPGKKPAWFIDLYQSALGADLSVDGKVPVLVDGPFAICESGIIADYIIKKFGTGTDLPPIVDPEQQARVAIFIEQKIPPFIKHWYGLLRAQDADSQAKNRDGLLQALEGISKAYERSGGPYFLGEKFSYADIMVWPWLTRLAVQSYYRGFTIPEGEKFAALHKFIAAMRARPTSIESQMPDDYYIELYVDYSKGTR